MKLSLRRAARAVQEAVRTRLWSLPTVTLAIFLSTFTFSLTVLRSARSASEGGTVFVPRISLTLAFLLALASVVSLVLFLAHLTRQIRVETMLRQVHDDAVGTIATRRRRPRRRPPRLTGRPTCRIPRLRCRLHPF